MGQCLAGRNEADGIFVTPGIYNQQQAQREVHADGDVTIFSVIPVFNGKGVIILEHPDGVGEMYTVLFEVLSLLARIPFIVHVVIMHIVCTASSIVLD